jgi:hypothetical protein
MNRFSRTRCCIAAFVWLAIAATPTAAIATVLNVDGFADASFNGPIHFTSYYSTFPTGMNAGNSTLVYSDDHSSVAGTAVASVDNGNAAASSSANLASGELRIFARGFEEGTSAAYAALGDTVFLQLPAGMSGPVGVEVDATVHGTYSLAFSPIGYLTILDSVNNGVTYSQHKAALDQAPETFITQFSVPEVGGVYKFILNAVLDTRSYEGSGCCSIQDGFIDFSNTAAIHLKLPDGVTYTSQSGVFLTNPVPEPSTFALAASGVLSLVCVSWRLRSARSSQTTPFRRSQVGV